MTPMLVTTLGVGLAGGAASALRFALDCRWPAQAEGSALDRQAWGLWAANLSACLLLGCVSTASSGPWAPVLSAGAAGGLSTWSSWAVSARDRWRLSESVESASRRQARSGVVLQVLGQICAGGLLVLLGRQLGGQLL